MAKLEVRLRCLPVRIRTNVQKDHTRVVKWIMACLVLHNFLSLRGEDDDWLEGEIEEVIEHEEEEESSQAAVEPQPQRETNSEMRIAGQARSTALREKLQEESSLFG